MKKLMFFLCILLGLQTANAQIKWQTWGNPNQINAVCEDGNYIWVGTSDGLVKRHKNGTYVALYNRDNSGILNNNITSLTLDQKGSLWIGIMGAGISKFDGTNWTNFTTENSGLSDNQVISIVIDPAGIKWIASYNKGLIKYNDTTWTTYDTSITKLPFTGIYTIAIDQLGNKWLTSQYIGLIS